MASIHLEPPECRNTCYDLRAAMNVPRRERMRVFLSVFNFKALLSGCRCLNELQGASSPFITEVPPQTPTSFLTHTNTLAPLPLPDSQAKQRRHTEHPALNGGGGERERERPTECSGREREREKVERDPEYLERGRDEIWRLPVVNPSGNEQKNSEKQTERRERRPRGNLIIYW